MTREEWRPILECEKYFVSNLGRIKSLKGSKEIILKPATLKKGYLIVGVRQSGVSRSFRVHRLVAAAFIPNPDNKPQVNHIDGDKLNNCVSNLEWCSNRENVVHAFASGLVNRDTFVSSKLTFDIADEMRSRNEKGQSIVSLAKEYNVSYSAAYFVISNRSWTRNK
jgi:hypothetical protein